MQIGLQNPEISEFVGTYVQGFRRCKPFSVMRYVLKNDILNVMLRIVPFQGNRRVKILAVGEDGDVPEGHVFDPSVHIVR